MTTHKGAVPVYTSPVKTSSTVYKQNTPSEVTNPVMLLQREQSGKPLTAHQALILADYKRTQLLSGAKSKPVSTQGNINAQVNKSSTLNSANKNLGVTVPPWGTVMDNPSDKPDLGDTGSDEDMLAQLRKLLGTSIVPNTVTPYSGLTLDQMKGEASTAASQIYNPILNALQQAQQDYEKARQLGRQDIAAQYAQRIADLKALSVATETSTNQYRDSSTSAYQQAAQNIMDQTNQAMQTNQGQYGALQDTYSNSLNQLGLSGLVNPNNSGILRDKAFTDAMLQGIGNIGQSSMQSGSAAAESAMNQLNANNVAQFNALQGQSGITRDQALRDLDQQTLQQVMQGRTQIGQTQSDEAKYAYDTLKSLQDTNWNQQQTTAGTAFDQSMANAQLALQLLGVGSSGGSSGSAGSTIMTNKDIGTAAFNQAFGQSADYDQWSKIWNYILGQHNYSDSRNTPYGQIVSGVTPGLGGFVGSPYEQMYQSRVARVFESLMNQHLISGEQDPNWQQFLHAMDLTQGNKSVSNNASIG